MRAVIEKEILYFIDKFRPGSKNVEIYKDLFSRLNDDQFNEWMERLGQGESLVLYAPLEEQPILNTKNNIAIGKELGYPLHQKLLLTDPGTGQVKWTPNKYLVGKIPVRRQVQMLVKKSSIPDSNNVTDLRSGQAAGSSKGARFSSPEIHINASKGLEMMVNEMIKFRGGDSEAYELMNKSLIETGTVSMSNIMSENPSQVKATKSLSIYLKAMLLQNNL